MVNISRIDKSLSEDGHRALYAGGIAAILASTCHHISFLLFALGLSNARVIYIVTLADMVRPFLIIIAIIMLLISYLRIWHISLAYRAGSDNTISRVKVIDRVFFIFIVLLVIAVLMLPYFVSCTE